MPSPTTSSASIRSTAPRLPARARSPRSCSSTERIPTRRAEAGSPRWTPLARTRTRSLPRSSARTGRWRNLQTELSNSLLLELDVRARHLGRRAAAEVGQSELDLGAEKLQHFP